MSRPVSFHLLTAAWLFFWLTGFVLTHIPIQPKGPPFIPHLDKLAHVILFALISTLGGVRSGAPAASHTRTRLAMWTLAYLAYAAFDELTQPMTGRDADLMDWICDALGVGLGTWIAWKRIGAITKTGM